MRVAKITAYSTAAAAGIAFLALVRSCVQTAPITSIDCSQSSSPVCGNGHVYMPAPPRNEPLETDFKLTLTSDPIVDLGGEFDLRLTSLSSPLPPTSCHVHLNGYAAHYVAIEQDSCDFIRLRAPNAPIPREADGRARADAVSTFLPIVTIGFVNGHKFDVSKIDGLGSLGIRNSTNVNLALESNTHLTRSKPIHLIPQFPAGPIPSDFTCEWSDVLDELVNVKRRYLNDNQCDYEITIVNGHATQLYYEGIKSIDSGGFDGQLALLALKTTRPTVSLRIIHLGETYVAANIGVQLEMPEDARRDSK